HRLIQFGSITDHTAEATIPARTIQQLERFEVVDTITVIFGSGVVHFLAGDGQALCGRTLDGTYPNYGQLFPQSFTGEMTVNRKQLRDAVSRAAIIARNSNDVLRINPSEDNGTLNVGADNDTGAASETIALDSCSAPCNFAINCDYLREALEPFAHEHVVFHMVGPVQPIVLEPSDPDAQVQPIRSLIMPVQVRPETPAKTKKAKVAQ
ncbi:MAG: DNA polymerase III subunit beta, partial [Actinomycetales bacterium]|nr:DNA polymerase III subunit beta [Actinomycetales bacterium]